MRGVNYLKVQGHEGLVRDTTSGAIISNNNNEFEVYRQKREVEKNRQDMLNKQIKEIDELKNDMLEIKQMLNILITQGK